MFDLTVLPYFVFAFMAIPPFIFGYFKGWRSGLFTLGLTVVAGGILIGICYGIYESTLWPLFKNLFIQNHNDANLDIESLKSISRTSAISIAVGIGLIPMMLIMWGLYMGLKRFINKYMNPRIKKLASNEVSISRKNLKLTRAGGVALNGVAGLIVASAAAGAVSTLVTPSTKSNFFNSLTNTFADGMTFGQGQYNENYQRMFEFVKSRKHGDEAIEKFDELFDMHQSTNGKFGDVPALLALFNAVGGSDEFIRETNLMAKDSKEISKALVMMLLGATKTQRDFHLVGFDDAHANGQGTDLAKDKIAEDNIIASLKALETFTNSQKTGFTWNLNGVREAIDEIFNKKYIDFEKSPYYQNWKHSTDLLAIAKQELITRQTDLRTTTSAIASQRSSQAADVRSFQEQYRLTISAWDEITNAIARIGISAEPGDSIPTMPIFASAPWSYTWTYVDDNEVEQDKGMIIQGGRPLTPITTPGSIGSYKKMTDQEIVKQGAERDYSAAINNTNKAQGILDGFNTVLQNMQDQLSDYQDDLSSAERAKVTAETTIKNYPAEKSRLDKNLASEQTNNGRLSGIAATLSAEARKLDDQKIIADNNVTTARTNFTTAEKALTDERTKTKGLQSVYDLADQTYSDALADDKTADADLSTASAGLDVANTNFNAAKKQVDDEQAEVDRINKIHSDALAAASKITSGTQPKIPPIADETKLNAAKDAKTKAESVQVMADAAHKKALAAKTITAKALADALTARDVAKAALDDNTKNIKALITERDQKQTDLQNRIREQETAAQNIKNKSTAIDLNQTDIDTSNARIKNIQNDIAINDQSLKDAKQAQKDAIDKIAKAKVDITKEKGLIATQQSKISDQETIVSGFTVISDKAFGTKTKAEDLYNQLKGTYDADHMILQKYKAALPGYKSKATSLKTQIDDANAQLKKDILHQRVLNDKIDPSDKDYADEHKLSIPYQEDVIKNSDKLLQAALDLKNKQEGLNDDRAKELKELVTKLFS